ncbi:MAG: glycosyltransferase [Gemmataceae bacterium]|nr:glycosyltransferase [Gemmataceae bacterium]MCI0743696.1 glycosyltransferase [Gemmataceae bacterium]
MPVTKTESPLVSIITPSYNQGRFLRATVASVLAQDYPRIEYLVIDGASTDDSVAVLQSFGSRFYWISEPDRGQAHAVNKGLARARGDIRAYLNSDDVFLPGAVSSAVAYLQQHADCDVAFGQAQLVDETGRFLDWYPTEDYRPARLFEHCFLCQPATFWRRRVQERVGLFDEALHYALDLDYWLRVEKCGGRFGHCRTAWAASRWHDGAKTFAQREAVLREIIAVCVRHAGRAGMGRYEEYWRHRVFDKRCGWPRVLALAPQAAWYAALAHARWDSCHGRARSFLAEFGRALGRRMQRALLGTER